MEWKKIKTAAIIFLLLVNVFFIYELYVQYKNNFLIDSGSINDLVRLLDDDGIDIDKSIIPARKPALRVYEGNYEKYYDEVFSRIADTSDYTVSEGLPGILVYTDKEDGEIAEFDSAFGFTYYSSSDSRNLSDISGYTEAAVSQSVMKELKDTVGSFLFGKRSGLYERSGVDIYGIYSGTGEKTYYLKCTQMFDGVTVNGLDFYAVLRDGKILLASGRMLLVSPQSSYNSEQFDQINILMFEKKYIDSERENGNILVGSRIKIGAFENEYTVSWNNERTNFYLIPSWKISYSGGEEHIRNGISGTIYDRSQ